MKTYIYILTLITVFFIWLIIPDNRECSGTSEYSRQIITTGRTLFGGKMFYSMYKSIYEYDNGYLVNARHDYSPDVKYVYDETSGLLMKELNKRNANRHDSTLFSMKTH